jgi:hypothetical protein
LPSINIDSKHHLLDYHLFNIVKPKGSKSSSITPLPVANSATSEAPVNRMHYDYNGNSTEAKFTSTKLLRRGQLLHIDFSFWNLCSIRGFTSLLSAIAGKDRMLWNFPTVSKRIPLSILDYLFTMLDREGVTIENVRVDEDSALANNLEFSDFLIQHKISLQTTGGYASFLNGKVERHHRTIAQMVRSLLLNSGLPSDLWCYAAEAAADIYRYTLHSTLGKTPYEAWYGQKPSIDHLRVWGCYVYVHLPDPKKLEHQVTRGNFLGFTKSRLIIC